MGPKSLEVKGLGRHCAPPPLRLKWALLDLNQGPSDYESGALTKLS